MSDKAKGPANLEGRVIELEVKMGFAEDLLDAMNQQLYRQQELIDGLRRQLIDLQRQMDGAAGAAGVGPRDEIPPHY